MGARDTRCAARDTGRERRENQGFPERASRKMRENKRFSERMYLT